MYKLTMKDISGKLYERISSQRVKIGFQIIAEGEK